MPGLDTLASVCFMSAPVSVHFVCASVSGGVMGVMSGLCLPLMMETLRVYAAAKLNSEYCAWCVFCVDTLVVCLCTDSEIFHGGG